MLHQNLCDASSTGYRFDRDEIGPDQCPLLAGLITKSESLVLIE